MLYRISTVFLMAVCFAATAAAQAPIKFEPETLEEKIEAADVIVLGTVQSAAPEQERGTHDNVPNRVPYIAVVKIEKIYKGSTAEEEITVQFTHSERTTRPPLVELRNRERAVLFLKSARGAKHLEFISPFTGKEKATYSLTQKLEAISEERGLAADVSATLALETATAPPGGPVFVKLRIDNKSSVPVLFNAMPDPGADLIVIGPDGEPLAANSGARDKHAASYTLRLPPGGFFGYSADLAKLFDLSAPGQYTATAVFVAPSGGDPSAFSGAIQSQSVTFTISR